MTARLLVAALILLGGRGLSPGVAANPEGPAVDDTRGGVSSPRADARRTRDQLAADLDAILADPSLSRALVAVRIDSLATGHTLYARDAGRLVMPASNMKILTVAVAAERLGWDYRYVTTLEAAGTIDAGVLHGDLIVTGSGDPSIVSLDGGPAPLFAEWADALRRAGIRRVDGRLIGDDRAFDSRGLGGGWSWDYLADGYAASSGALNYNENVATLTIAAGALRSPASVVVTGPAGHGLEIANETMTMDDPAGGLDVARLPGSSRVIVRGQVRPGARVTRSVTVDNPTRFFVTALVQALATRGITIGGGAWDLDDLPAPPPLSARQTIATRESLPLSVLAAHCMKVSQNFYAEALLKTVGRARGPGGSIGPTGSNASVGATGSIGSIASGRAVAREVLTGWGVPADSYVIADGSGLSRYDYVTADALVTILTRMWTDERHRGPWTAAMPVGGQDGTLASRMKGTALETNVQAKTGTIANVRALSGYLRTKAGEKLAFSIVANHFTAPSGTIDAVVERALARVVDGPSVTR